MEVMPNRLAAMSDTFIMITGCFLSTSTQFDLLSILTTYGIWMIAYILFMSTRKPIYRFLKDLLEKTFNKNNVKKFCEEDEANK